jgi:hypothetical protein
MAKKASVVTGKHDKALHLALLMLIQQHIGEGSIGNIDQLCN